jgi:hypothetical protein
MRKYAGVCAGLALCMPLALLGAESPEGPFVTETMIEEQGGVHFSLPNLGTFTIEAVEHSAGTGECHVSLQSVARSIENSILTGDLGLIVGAKGTVKLKAFFLENGNIVCYGPGTNCKVKVSVESVASM